MSSSTVNFDIYIYRLLCSIVGFLTEISYLFDICLLIYQDKHMEQKSNVQLNSKCKIIDISQKSPQNYFINLQFFRSVELLGLVSCCILRSSGKQTITLQKKEDIMAKDKDLRFIRTNQMLAVHLRNCLIERNLKITSRDSLLEELLVKEYSILLGMFLTE